MTAPTSKLIAGTAASISSGSITGTFQKINANSLTGSPEILRLVNATNQLLEISYDGSTLHDAVPAATTAQIDAALIRSATGIPIAFDKDLEVWVRGSSGTGTFYASYYYRKRR